jgi:CDP-glucose 4,6-dehydratase
MDEPTTFRWRGRRVLVTGCTGFLGGAVVRDLLGRGAEVVGLVADRGAAGEFARHGLAGKVRVVHGRPADLFRVHSALAVYEAAAVFHLDGGDCSAGTVAEAARRYDPRTPVVIVRSGEGHLASRDRQGAGEPNLCPLPGGRGSPETAPPLPLGVARFGVLFGGGDHDTTRPVPATVLGLLNGDRAGSADGRAREYVHVRDAARACVLLADAVAANGTPHLRDESFRTGWRLTDRELTVAVRELLAGRPPQVPHAEPTANALGWVPAQDFAHALAETVSWYREFARTRTRPLDPPHRAAA